MTEYIFLKREIKLTYPKIFLLKTAGASILAMCVIVLLPDADFWNLLLRLFVSVAVFGITIYALKPFTVDDYRITKEVLNPLAKYLKPFVK